MYEQVEKTIEKKSQSVSAADSQFNGGGESSFQFVDNRPEAIAQRKLQKMANSSPQAKQVTQLQAIMDNHSTQQKQPIQKKENNTGLPDSLKSGIENLSGYSMDDVKVHYNSDKPAQLQAHAYAQGSDIHLGPGQEKHLPHEAWHVVQQKQGRVKPTVQMTGKENVNDDAEFEREADIMGSKAADFNPTNHVAIIKDNENSGRNISSSLQMFVMQLFRMTGSAQVTLLGQPNAPLGSVHLPANTRIKILNTDILGLYGDNHGPNQWIEVEVTTGPSIGEKGWVQSQDLDPNDQAETAQVSFLKATELFNELKNAKFTSSKGEQANIPFSYPIDGCYARAHRMMELLTEKGYTSEKSFAVAKSTNRLRVASSSASDTAIGTAPTVQWGYHVAPVITLETGIKYVIDPSMFGQPVSLVDWVGGMGNIADFNERSIGDLRNEYEAGNLPDENRYYTAPKEQYFPVMSGGHLPDNAGNIKYNEVGPMDLGKDRMMSYAKYNEPVHILASKIRGVINSEESFPNKLQRITDLGRAESPAVGKQFGVSFPQLHKQMKVIKLGAQITGELDKVGTQDEKYHALKPILYGTEAGIADILKI